MRPLKLPRRQRGFLGELISGIFNWSGGKKQRESDIHMFESANDFSERMQEDTQAFNADQAAIARAWNAEQAELARQFSSNEALAARRFNADEAGIGRVFSADQARLQYERNALEAQKNRDFQERMSNTQYQRAIADMQSAGLSPMLAYSQGGAGNVGGSTASSQAASASVASGPAASGSAASGPSASSGSTSSVAPPRSPNILGGAASSAISAASALAGVEQLDAATGKTKAETAAIATQVELMKTQAGLNTAQRAEVEQRVRDQLYQWDTGYRQSNIRNEAELKAREVNIKDEEWRQKQVGTEYQRLEGPARVGEARMHEFLNRELVGGGSSAAMIKSIVLEALRGLIRR